MMQFDGKYAQSSSEDESEQDNEQDGPQEQVRVVLSFIRN
jgi:hypothetical protein